MNPATRATEASEYRHLVAAEAAEMTVFEDFVLQGRSILGLYPPTDENSRSDFAA